MTDDRLATIQERSERPDCPHCEGEMQPVEYCGEDFRACEDCNADTQDVTALLVETRRLRAEAKRLEGLNSELGKAGHRLAAVIQHGLTGAASAQAVGLWLKATSQAPSTRNDADPTCPCRRCEDAALAHPQPKDGETP